jgi:hypothetical protein
VRGSTVDGLIGSPAGGPVRGGPLRGIGAGATPGGGGIVALPDPPTGGGWLLGSPVRGSTVDAGGAGVDGVGDGPTLGSPVEGPISAGGVCAGGGADGVGLCA